MEINKLKYIYTKNISLRNTEKKRIRNQKNFEQKKSKIFDKVKKLLNDKKYLKINETFTKLFQENSRISSNELKNVNDYFS